MNDKQAIRDVIAEWNRASLAGDLPAVQALMEENVVFLQPGQQPMRGQDAFATGFHAAFERFRFEIVSDVQEIEVAGDWAYCWNHLTVTLTPRPEGSPMRRSGNVLSVFHKKPEGNWVIFRDANMLTVEEE